MLEDLITSKTRLRLLIKFFISQANSGYLNGLAREMDGSTNKIRKELNHLEKAGYLIKYKSDKKIQYQANTKHPLFDVLRKIVLKHLGIEDIVESVLDKMGNVEKIILVGDYAKGIDSGGIEVFLIGQNLNTEYISQLEQKIEKLIGRKVSFYLASKFLYNYEHIVLFNSIDNERI